MRCRPHGRKPTLALWMLVAVADLAIVAATAGPVLMLTVTACLVTAVIGGRGLWLLQHRNAPAPRTQAVVRRRA